MSRSVLASFGKHPVCKFCGNPIEPGKAVVLLHTEVYRWKQQILSDGKTEIIDDSYDIETGEITANIDWDEDALVHVGCLQSAIEMARDRG